MISSLAGVTLLVVDDDRETLALYGATLQAVGAEVRTADSVGGAIATLETWRPDVVLCDLHLPDVDGYGLLQHVKADRSLRDIPVISISGSHPDVERKRSSDAGFAQHLTKPAKLADIVHAVSLHVKQTAAHAADG